MTDALLGTSIPAPIITTVVVEDAPVVTPVTSRRDQIRAKLRASEERLTQLVRTTSVDSSDSAIHLAKNLQKVEEEKSALETELEKLRNETAGDEFLQEKMSGIQEGFQKQVERIQQLEDENVSKDNEIDHLRDELVRKLRRIVELEFDLETHDVHYTEYAADQFRLGEEALAEIKMAEQNGQDLDGSERSRGKKPLSPRRAQKLISKLLNDLDNLEARYKEEKLNFSSEQELAKLLEDELRTRINILEQRQNGGTADDSNSTASIQDQSERSTISVSAAEQWLRRRVETLEAKRTLYRQQMLRKEQELTQAKEAVKTEARNAKTEIERLKMENQAMKSRIRALETDILDSEDDADANHYAVLEKKIRDSFEEIARLEAAGEIKDRQVASLKKDVTKLRLSQIAHAQGMDEKQFTEQDVQLLQDDAMRAPAGSNSAMKTLQTQLEVARQEVVKKEQELVIERAKAASNTASLLARISELTQNQKEPPTAVVEEVKEEAKSEAESAPSLPESKRKGGRRANRKVPRFYQR